MTFNYYANASLALAGWHCRARGSGSRRARASWRARGGVPRRPADDRRRGGAGPHHRDACPTRLRGIRLQSSRVHRRSISTRARTNSAPPRASTPACRSTGWFSRRTWGANRSRSTVDKSPGCRTHRRRCPTSTVVDDGRTRMRVRVDGATEPFWLVLGQSASEGWTASTDGAQVGERRLVAGYANGWLMDPDSESFEVVLEWTPQRRVWAALGLSLLGVIGCAVVVGFTWWRRRGKLAAATAPDADDARTQTRVAACGTVAVGLAACAGSGPARRRCVGRSGRDAVGRARRRRVGRVRPTIAGRPPRSASCTAGTGRVDRRVHRVEPTPLRHPARLRMADPVPESAHLGLAGSPPRRRRRRPRPPRPRSPRTMRR